MLATASQNSDTTLIEVARRVVDTGADPAVDH